MTAAIGLLAFGLFITAVVLGIGWLLRQDTNRPDTALSLYLAFLTPRLQHFSRTMDDLQRAFTLTIPALNRLARSFSKAMQP